MKRWLSEGPSIEEIVAERKDDRVGKRRKAAPGNEIHRVEEGQTMYDISQIYGVKLKHLYAKNHMMEGEQPLEGTEIYLRRKKREPVLKLEPSPVDYEEEETQFRFDF